MAALSNPESLDRFALHRRRAFHVHSESFESSTTRSSKTTCACCPPPSARSAPRSVPSAWRSSSSKRCLCGGPRLHAARSACGKVLQSERAGCAEDRPDLQSQRGAFVCLFWVPAVTLRRSSFACRMIRGSVCRRTPGGTQGTHGYSRVSAVPSAAERPAVLRVLMGTHGYSRVSAGPSAAERKALRYLVPLSCVSD